MVSGHPQGPLPWPAGPREAVPAPHCCFRSGLPHRGPGPHREDPAPPSLSQLLEAPRSPQHAPATPAAMPDTHAPRSVSLRWGRPGTFSAKGAGYPRPGGTAGVPVSRGMWGCRAPWDARKPPGNKCLHGCTCSAPRKVPAHRGVPGLGAADGSHAWATGCPPSGTLLPASCTAPTHSAGAGCWSGAPG